MRGLTFAVLWVGLVIHPLPPSGVPFIDTLAFFVQMAFQLAAIGCAIAGK